MEDIVEGGSKNKKTGVKGNREREGSEWSGARRKKITMSEFAMRAVLECLFRHVVVCYPAPPCFFSLKGQFGW